MQVVHAFLMICMRMLSHQEQGMRVWTLHEKGLIQTMRLTHLRNGTEAKQFGFTLSRIFRSGLWADIECQYLCRYRICTSWLCTSFRGPSGTGW